MVDAQLLSKIVDKMHYFERNIDDHILAERINGEIVELTETYIRHGGTIDEITETLDAVGRPYIPSGERIREALNRLRLEFGLMPKIRFPRQSISTQMIKPGDDYNMRGDPIDILERHGWKAFGTGRKVRLRAPGKHKASSSASYDRFGERELIVYSSTNTQPFEVNKKYKPFAIFTLLEHNGDFKAAAKDLTNKGYGR